MNIINYKKKLQKKREQKRVQLAEKLAEIQKKNEITKALHEMDLSKFDGKQLNARLSKEINKQLTVLNFPELKGFEFNKISKKASIDMYFINNKGMTTWYDNYIFLCNENDFTFSFENFKESIGKYLEIRISNEELIKEQIKTLEEDFGKCELLLNTMDAIGMNIISLDYLKEIL